MHNNHRNNIGKTQESIESYTGGIFFIGQVQETLQEIHKNIHKIGENYLQAEEEANTRISSDKSISSSQKRWLLETQKEFLYQTYKQEVSQIIQYFGNQVETLLLQEYRYEDSKKNYILGMKDSLFQAAKQKFTDDSGFQKYLEEAFSQFKPYLEQIFDSKLQEKFVEKQKILKEKNQTKEGYLSSVDHSGLEKKYDMIYNIQEKEVQSDFLVYLGQILNQKQEIFDAYFDTYDVSKCYSMEEKSLCDIVHQLLLDRGIDDITNEIQNKLDNLIHLYAENISKIAEKKNLEMRKKISEYPYLEFLKDYAEKLKRDVLKDMDQEIEKQVIILSMQVNESIYPNIIYYRTKYLHKDIFELQNIIFDTYGDAVTGEVQKYLQKFYEDFAAKQYKIISESLKRQSLFTVESLWKIDDNGESQEELFELNANFANALNRLSQYFDNGRDIY